MTNYIIADTEGSGIFDFNLPADAPGQPRMAALGLILVTPELEIEETHSFLIRPQGWNFDNDSPAAKVNGLTHERLMDEGVDLASALEPYVAAVDRGRVVAGFNVLFDLKQLRAEMRYVGLEDRFMKTKHLCAMQGCRKIVDARTADGRKKAPKLEEACAFFKIERHGAHTGIGDALDTLQILRHLRDRGEFPAYKDPWDKGFKGSPKPKTDWVRPQGREYEEQVVREQQDFIGGANEDDK